MKLLYSGSSACDEPTLKRLLLVGTELVFMDRPSVTFAGKWGTVGHTSIFATSLQQVNQLQYPFTLHHRALPRGCMNHMQSLTLRTTSLPTRFSKVWSILGLPPKFSRHKRTTAMASQGKPLLTH
jgi:hypothetical protein